jgi:AcrR family transcriptional regulator
MSVSTLRPRRTQAQRRDRTRRALLESAARGFSRYGYGNVVLEQVAAGAGYTRGALYHLFRGKEDLALAVVDWVGTTWEQEVGRLADDAPAPADAIIAVARGHVVFCRRDVARVLMALRVEFAGRPHPVGDAITAITGDATRRLASLVRAGRRDGTIPPGPPAAAVAVSCMGALEGLAIYTAGTPHDEVLAERAVRGLLGLPC